MIIAQGSDAWFALRLGQVTASRAADCRASYWRANRELQKHRNAMGYRY